MRGTRYDSRRVIGVFFEDLLARLFDLIKVDKNQSRRIHDLEARDGSFIMEVKGSHCKNGGVVNQEQLAHIGNQTEVSRFYASCYHPFSDIKYNYSTEEELNKALAQNWKSVYIFPYSIIRAFFNNSKLIHTPKHDSFVQLKEKHAIEIFQRIPERWKMLRLDPHEYKPADFHPKVHVMTRCGHLERELRKSFHPEFL